MSQFTEFPSIHDHLYGDSDHLRSLYEIGRSLSDKELQKVIVQVRAKGYRVEKLEFYEYAPSDSMRHLFVRMEDEAESIPTLCWTKNAGVRLQKR